MANKNNAELYNDKKKQEAAKTTPVIDALRAGSGFGFDNPFLTGVEPTQNANQNVGNTSSSTTGVTASESAKRAAVLANTDTNANSYDAGGVSTPPAQAPASKPQSGGSGGGGGSPAASQPAQTAPAAPKEWAGPTVESYYDPATDAAYQSALAALQTAQGNAPTYPGTYDAQLVDMYNTIVNRDPFKYDLNADMLYQQYAQQYVNKGRLAMMDTMGQAAGLTGGYGSSYGQMVGQQAYNSYLQELNNMIPEFYDRAYQQYADEGDWLLNQYKLLGDLSDTEYARYSDDYNRWLNERDYAQDLADQAYSRGYKEFEDRYNRGLDDAAFRAKVGDFGGYEDYYGEMVADRMQNNWLAANPDAAYRNGLMTPEEYNALTGSWPAGYTPPDSGGYYYGGGGSPEEEPPTEGDATEQQNYYVNTKEQLQTWKAEGWTNADVNNKLQELVNKNYITSTDKQKLYNLYRGR